MAIVVVAVPELRERMRCIRVMAGQAPVSALGAATWEELEQWDGSPEAAKFELDPQSIVQMEWKFTARGPEAPTNGELCIDDVRFMTE